MSRWGGGTAGCWCYCARRDSTREEEREKEKNKKGKNKTRRDRKRGVINRIDRMEERQSTLFNQYPPILSTHGPNLQTGGL